MSEREQPIASADPTGEAGNPTGGSERASSVAVFRVERVFVDPLQAWLELVACKPREGGDGLVSRAAGMVGTGLRWGRKLSPVDPRALVDGDADIRVARRLLDGISRDRLTLAANDAVQGWLRTAARARTLLEQHQGRSRVVFVTDFPEPVAMAFARFAGVQDVICPTASYADRGGVLAWASAQHDALNQLQVRNRLEQLGVSLTQATAYLSDTSDLALLSGARSYCAVNPTKALENIAIAQRWPVVVDNISFNTRTVNMASRNEKGMHP